LIGFEYDPLPLAEKAEDGAFQGTRSQKDRASVVVANDHPDPCFGIVGLDDSLHTQTFSTFPALIQEVQTRALRVFDPRRTLIRCMLGRQRRLFLL